MKAEEEIKKKRDKFTSHSTHRLVEDVVVAVAVIVVADFKLNFDWLDVFFGLTGGVFFGDFVDRFINDNVELLVPGVNLLIAPVFGPIGGIPTKLFCLGGEHPK